MPEQKYEVTLLWCFVAAGLVLMQVKEIAAAKAMLVFAIVLGIVFMIRRQRISGGGRV
jgi:hypothetical protein